jgi:hypothetical protein
MEELRTKMKRLRMFAFAALAVVVALGVSGQAFAVDPHFKIVTVGPVAGHTSDAEPQAASQVHQLMTNMGVAAPADSSGDATWPCFTGGSDPDCSSIAAGGLVVGIPFYTWSLSSCTSSSAACGQIYWAFETDVASTKAPIEITLNVTQGSNVIYSTGSAPLNVGPNPGKGYMEIISGNVGFGVGDCGAGVTCVAPVAGAATITTTTKIGTSTATGKAVIVLSASE